MLDGLDDVAWGELEHAYGRADNIPVLLRRLAFGDPQALDDFRFADDGLVHQGCVYPATAAAVPFLVERCPNPDPTAAKPAGRSPRLRDPHDREPSRANQPFREWNPAPAETDIGGPVTPTSQNHHPSRPTGTRSRHLPERRKIEG